MNLPNEKRVNTKHFPNGNRILQASNNSDSTMGKFNTTTVMLIDEDIQLKMQNARILMQEDIENALLSAKDEEGEPCFYIDLECPSYLDGDSSEDSCYQVAMEDGIIFACEFGDRAIDDLNYEQLHTVYEALKYEGYFTEVEN